MTRYRWGITGACILFLAGVIVYNLREFLAYDYLFYYAGGKSVNWFLDYPSSLYDLDILRELCGQKTLDIFSVTAACGLRLRTRRLPRDFYPFTGRYPGVDAHTLLLRAADEQPVMFVTSIPALALVVLVVLWAVLLRRPAENMQ